MRGVLTRRREEVLLTAYNACQKVGKHNALSGNTTLGRVHMQDLSCCTQSEIEKLSI